MSIPLNPYIAGNPVGGGDAFVGRVDVLRSVLRVLKSPNENAIVLYGQRRIGKTSVLLELAQRLPQEGNYRPIYFDLQDKAAAPLATVLYELAQRIAASLGATPPAPDAATLPVRFRQEFLTAVLQKLPSDTSLVLLFDEFDVLDNPAEGQAAVAFFPYLRDLLTFNPRLQFVFVIGRRPEDLTSLTLSVFKGVKSERVSLLSTTDTGVLVRLSERNGSLRWHDEAVNKIFALTGGHPFLTQHLCQELWEAIYEKEPTPLPTVSVLTVSARQVDDSVDAALRKATNALEWLWNGLGPAQRIVASALAETGPQAISQEALEGHLQKSGVRILVGELQNAPRLLQDWDIIEPVSQDSTLGYRFRVELLRRWIAERKPLARVQEELDFVQPAAESLFQAAYNFYKAAQLDAAVPLLRQASGLNPNHVRASLLLSEILLAQNQPDEARQLLEALYQVQPSVARPRLVQAWMQLLERTPDEATRLTLLNRVLTLEPNHIAARQQRQVLWRSQLAALERTTDDESRLTLLNRVLALEPNYIAARQQRQVLWRSQLAALEQAERYDEALALARQLVAELPADDTQRPDLALLQRKTQLAGLYQRGVKALKQKDRATATRLFAEVIALEPTYREVSRYFYQAVNSVDVSQLETTLQEAQRVQLGLDTQLRDAHAAQKNTERSLESERSLRQSEAGARQLRQPSSYLTWGLGLLALLLALYVGNDLGLFQLFTVSVLMLFGVGLVLVLLVLYVVNHRDLLKRYTPSARTSAAIPKSDPARWGSQLPVHVTSGTVWMDDHYALTFVAVPDGNFRMGSEDGRSNEKPIHEVYLGDFWITQSQVTNAQYASCVKDGKCTKPNNNQWNQPQYANHPVVNVTWQQAVDYATWVGGHLPTEAEWEKVARGTDGRIYPWGNQEPTPTLLNYMESKIDSTTEVMRYPAGKSPYGAFDMAGNVWEWTADWYDANYYASSPSYNPSGPATGNWHVCRGGSYYSESYLVRASYRNDYYDGGYDDVGFRVVRAAAPGS